MSAHHRSYLIIDEFGIDPLRDQSYDTIKSVNSFELYTIPSAEHLNPALTAYKRWRNTAWWWVLLVYNDLDDLWDFTEGSQIRIPDINELTTRLHKLNSRREERVVVI